MAPVLALVTMTAIDLSEGYNVKSKMQTSLDAALLSATLEAQGLSESLNPAQRQSELETAFEDFYSANFSNLMYDNESYTLQKEDYTLTFDDVSNKVTALVNFDYDGAASKLASFYDPTIQVSSTTSMKVVVDNYIIDVVMCIDATGSMQNTLDSVKDAAKTFNTDLRSELSVPAENLKIRVRPIFYRDWDDEYYYQNQNATPPGWSYYYWHTWYINYRLGGRQNYEGGMVHYPVGDGFIDLDPSNESGIDQNAQTTNFTNFIGSERAAGGFDWPEGAGACLNDGIRSSWFDNQSQEAKDYFDIPNENTIVSTNEDTPEGPYSRVTTIPVIVFWTDATINSLSLSRQYLSATTPVSYSAFRDLWREEQHIDQELKLLIHFGPGSGQGWNNIKYWDRYKYGGSLSVGNRDGVKRIAEEISDAVPDILRISS